jgi:hypothetical protein
MPDTSPGSRRAVLVPEATPVSWAGPLVSYGLFQETYQKGEAVFAAGRAQSSAIQP